MTPPSPDNLREAVAAKLVTQAERREANARYLRHSIGDEVKDTLHRVLAEASEVDAALFRQAAELLSLPALSVPEGWVAVPRGPTEEMIAKAREICDLVIALDNAIEAARSPEPGEDYLTLSDGSELRGEAAEAVFVLADAVHDIASLARSLSAIPSPGGEGTRPAEAAE